MNAAHAQSGGDFFSKFSMKARYASDHSEQSLVLSISLLRLGTFEVRLSGPTLIGTEVRYHSTLIQESATCQKLISRRQMFLSLGRATHQFGGIDVPAL